MKILNNKWLLLIIVMAAGMFYWFQYRPSEIIKACYKEAEDLPGEILMLLTGDYHCEEGYKGGVGCVKREMIYDKMFRVCLNKNGLVKFSGLEIK